MENFDLLKNHSFFIALLSVLIFNCCGTKPPTEKGDFLESDLVDLTPLESTFVFDIKYATSDNFVGRPVYPEAKAFLQRPAAMALVEASKDLKDKGFGIKIFDGYRPWSVTKLFWDITPEEKRDFVANPKEGSRHNRGCAIDMTIYDLKTGEEVTMPSGYDEFTNRAYPDYSGGTQQERTMRDMLISIMESHHFTVYEFEWWHFDYKDWREYRIQNIPFSEIK